MPSFRKAAYVDENFPRLPDVESSQSLQGVEMSEIAAMNGLFRMSGNSHLNLKMDEPEDDGRTEVYGTLDLASVELKHDVLHVRKNTVLCSNVEVHHENPDLLTSLPAQAPKLGAG